MYTLNLSDITSTFGVVAMSVSVDLANSISRVICVNVFQY
jgi:hypothetical protein